MKHKEKMKVYKNTTYDNITYYECQPLKGVSLFAFTKRKLIIDLCKIYGYALFKPINLS